MANQQTPQDPQQQQLQQQEQQQPGNRQGADAGSAQHAEQHGEQQAGPDFDGLKDKKPEELTPEELRWMADTMPGEGPGD